MKVSIAMATYKGEAYIREQLDSIAHQTVLPDELVITDDSPDSNTADIVAEFAKTAPFSVRFYRNAVRAGFPENFFKVIALCTGELIAFADQDDVWVPHKLERMVGHFQDAEVMLVTHRISLVDRDLKQIEGGNEEHWSYQGIYAPLTTDPWYIQFGMSMMARSDLFRVVDMQRRPADHTRDGGPLPHDMWAWFLGRSLGKLVALPDKLAMYRQHGANTVGAPPRFGLRERVRRSIRTGQSHYEKLSEISLHSAQVLSTITELRFVEQARRAEASYLQLHEAFANRAALYAPHVNGIGRCLAILKMIRHSTYRSVKRGGFGVKALSKDLYVALIC